MTSRRIISCLALAAGVGAPLPRAAAAEPAPGPTTVQVRLPRAALQVHLNQVALERTGPKRAVVVSAGTVTRGRYRVRCNGRIAAAGTMQALPAFTAWGAGRQHFEVDFSAWQQAGTCQVEAQVAGRRVRSAPVRVVDDALLSVTGAQLVDYFRRSRHTGDGDRRIRIFETDRFVDVHGGWKDAGGDSGKYLSHLGYANFFNPQQTSMAAWVLAYTADTAGPRFQRAGLLQQVQDEAFWGADYLHRILDAEGYFYTTVFDKWGDEKAERMVVGYEGEDGRYTTLYRSAYRAGGGLAIAALARASLLARASGRQGEFGGATYLADAVRAFDHLQQFNAQYTANGIENIIDDYTALMAAVELFHATQAPRFLDAARARADRLLQRQAADGGFISDGGSRPFFHAVEAGLPVLSLAHFLGIETDEVRRGRVRAALQAGLQHEVDLTQRVSNPYGYARQAFQLAPQGRAEGPVLEGFFIPHQNETGYWWQGESARLTSLTTAMAVAGRQLGPTLPPAWAAYAQAQLDWTLGANPYGICMLYGFGHRQPPAVPSSAGDMVVGGISNGITGAVGSAAGEGISFAPGPDAEQWRWVEQWLPHTAWMLLAAVEVAR